MRLWSFPENERAAFGHTHGLEVTADDLTVTTVTTGQTLTPGLTFALGSFVSRCSHYLKVPFQDASDSASIITAMAVGETVGSTTSLLKSTELNVNGTEIITSTCVPHVGTAGTPVTGFTAATNLIITVATPTSGKALNDIDVGVVYFYFCIHSPVTFSNAIATPLYTK